MQSARRVSGQPGRPFETEPSREASPPMKCQRDLFSLPDGQHYLNCAYMSPLLKAVETAGLNGLKRKTVPAEIGTADFFDPAEELRQSFARLIHTSPERIALIPAVSYGMGIATYNLPIKPDQNVVIPGEEFPSNVYPWLEQCKRTRATLRTVDRPRETHAQGKVWNTRFLEAIDTHTAVVALSSVHWTDGTLFDLEQIGQRAREVGALFIVDGTQSVGALPFDFERVQSDLLVCAGYKWLLGPYQYSFAAVGNRLLDGEPFEHNWINRKDSQNFSALINYQSEYQPGARRFDTGERSNFIMIPMLLAALKQIGEWGVDNIQTYCARLSEELGLALDGTPYTVAPPHERAAHLFGVRIAAAEHIPAILEALRRRDVYVSQRGSSIRVSPHVYNTKEDILALAEALRAVMR